MRRLSIWWHREFSEVRFVSATECLAIDFPNYSNRFTDRKSCECCTQTSRFPLMVVETINELHKNIIGAFAIWVPATETKGTRKCSSHVKGSYFSVQFSLLWVCHLSARPANPKLLNGINAPIDKTEPNTPVLAE